MSIPFIQILSEELLTYFVRGGVAFYFTILISGFVFGLSRLKRLSSAGKGIWMIITISLFLELLGSYLSISIDTSAPSSHMVLLLHFLAYGYTFSKFRVNRRFERGFLWAGILLAGFSAVNVIWIQELTDHPTLPSLLLAIALVLGSLVSYYNMMRSPSPTPLLKQGLFWFNTSTLFFYASTFFSYALHDHYLAQWYETGEYMPTWAVYLMKGMNYYLYVSLIIAMWFDLKRQGDSRV
jgi:hypothetical protein